MAFLTFTSRNTLRVFSTTTMVMALSPMSPPKPESPLPAGARAPSGSITTTTAASIFSFCNSQSSTNPFGVAISSPASVGIAAPPSTSPCPTGSFITTVTAPSPTSAANRASPAGPGKDGAWLPPTSTTMGGWTSLSATTPFRLARSGMGVDACDYDQDGWIDLFFANIDHEMFSLYHNSRDETFTDVAPGLGIASSTMMLSGMGQKFFDYDNDGNLDLL